MKTRNPTHIQAYHLLPVICSTNLKFNDSSQLCFSLLINVPVTVYNLCIKSEAAYTVIAVVAQHLMFKIVIHEAIKVLRVRGSFFMYCPKAVFYWWLILVVVNFQEQTERTGDTKHNLCAYKQRFFWVWWPFEVIVCCGVMWLSNFTFILLIEQYYAYPHNNEKGSEILFYTVGNALHPLFFLEQTKPILTKKCQWEILVYGRRGVALCP